MKKTTFPLLALLATAFLTTLVACEELPTSETSPSPQASASQQNVIKPNDPETFMATLAGPKARVWRLESRRVDGDVETLDCYRDDEVTFGTDRSVKFNVGSTPCMINNELQRSTSGFFQLTTEYNLLLFVTNTPYQARVQYLDDKQLILTFREDNGKEVGETYRMLKDENETPKPVASTRPVGGTGTTPVRPTASPTSSDEPILLEDR